MYVYIYIYAYSYPNGSNLIFYPKGLDMDATDNNHAEYPIGY